MRVIPLIPNSGNKPNGKDLSQFKVEFLKIEDPDIDSYAWVKNRNCR